jgi:hypothetical protein
LEGYFNYITNPDSDKKLIFVSKEELGDISKKPQKFNKIDNFINIKRGSFDAKIFPNPFKDQVGIEIYSKTNQDINVSILDLTGKVIENKSITVNPGKSIITFYQMDELNQDFLIITLNNQFNTQKSFKIIKSN